MQLLSGRRTHIISDEPPFSDLISQESLGNSLPIPVICCIDVDRSLIDAFECLVRVTGAVRERFALFLHETTAVAGVRVGMGSGDSRH